MSTLIYFHTRTLIWFLTFLLKHQYHYIIKFEEFYTTTKWEQSWNMVVSVKSVKSTITAPSFVNKGASFTISCDAEGYRPPTMIKLSKDGQDVVIWNEPRIICTGETFYKFKCSFDVPNSASRWIC